MLHVKMSVAHILEKENIQKDMTKHGNTSLG